MRRRAISWTLGLGVLFALLMPAAASATVFVRVEPDPRSGQKTLVVDSGISSNAITVTQETSGTLPAVGIQATNPNNPDEGFVIGRDCGTARNPPRAVCRTPGVVVIASNLRSQVVESPPEANSLDLTRVTQLTPDGTEPLPLRFFGGPGPDVITPGDRRIFGFAGAGDDVINGGPRDDDISDGAGNDIVLAGAGDDRFGDFHSPDSDILSGGPGRDSVISRGVVTLNDLLCNDGAAGDGPAAPFGVPRSVLAPEGTLACSGSGADRDLFAGIENVAQAFDNTAIDFTGSSADERLQGQQGSDRFEGGGGRDSLIGFEGNDLLLGRDETADVRIECGEGGGDDDRAVVDAVDPVEPSCETIERGRAGAPGPVGGAAIVPPLEGFRPAPPPSPPLGNRPGSGDEGNGAGGGDNGRTPPQLEIPTRVAFIRRNRIQIRVRCVYRAKNCKGTLTLRAAQSKRVGKRRVRKGTRLARGRVNVPWGTSRATTMRAPRSFVRLMRALRGKRTLRVRATVVAKDSGAGRRARSARASRSIVLGLQR